MSQTVAHALSQLTAPGTFATRVAAPSNQLEVEVKGFGRVPLPVTEEAADGLRKLARPSPFGLRDKTLHDASVRQTWEIAKSRVKVPARPWKPHLEGHLEHFRKQLGFPEGCRLQAVLDKLLIYERGHFFRAHQDSERDDRMVGSLLVLLPSEYAGGTLTVEHRGERKAFRRVARQSHDISLIAFYADCHHEVSTVTRGHRVALTFHLLLHEAKATTSAPRMSGVAALEQAVRDHFDATSAHPPAGHPAAPPDRLVYLLDHEYSQRSLSWGRLKGADRPRAEALLAVASSLDCDAALALARVHEVWNCVETGGHAHWSSRWGWDEEEEPEAASDVPGGLELLDLCDDDIELHGFRGVQGKPCPVMEPFVGPGELCFTTPSADLDPFESEYEGYQGNYGNTLERWYQRAALVLWPRERSFVLQARAAPGWAIEQLASIPEDQNDLLTQRVRSLLPTWHPGVAARDDAAFASLLLSVALRLQDRELCRAFIEGIGIAQLSQRAAQKAFAQLVARWGYSWGQALIERWDPPGWRRQGWAPRLPRLVATLVAHGGKAGSKLARTLLDGQVAEAREACERASKGTARWLDTDEYAEEAEHVAQVLAAAAELQAVSVLKAEQRFLLRSKDSIPLALLAQALDRCGALGEATVSALRGSPLHRAVVEGLQSALAAPPRAKNDWSMRPRLGCACADCCELARFLAAPREQGMDWPLAKQRRRHIHDAIGNAGLPVTHTTLRQGRPFVLQLRKRPSIRTKEVAYRNWQKALVKRVQKRFG